MEKGRLEAFSDSVLATLLTIMILQLGIPSGGELADLIAFCPMFLGYVISFLYIAIYWMNHHRLFLRVEHVDNKIHWCNIAWLFTMSFIPFATAWVGVNLTSSVPMVVYFVELLLVSLVFHLLGYFVSRANGESFKLSLRSIVSLAAHAITVLLAVFVH